MTIDRAPRSRALDVLRAVAVLLVIGAHTKGPRASTPDVVEGVMRVWTRGGWTGVDLFFVLSGFLVSGLLFTEQRAHGRIRVGRFLLRRGLRIYPAFWVYVAFTIVASVLLGRAVPLERVAAELLFVQNYVLGIWWGHTWSLAVEEHFYVLLPLLLLALARLSRAPDDPFRWLIAAFAIVAVVCLAFRIEAVPDRWSWRGHIYPTHMRIDSLLFGVVLSYLHHYRAEPVRRFVTRHRAPLVVAATALIAPAFFVPLRATWMHTIGFTMLYVGFGAVVLVAVHMPSSTSPLLDIAARALAAVGRHSYSIYLWHRVVLDLGRDRLVDALGFRPPFLVEMPLMTATAIALGVLMSKAIEVPALRVRDRWWPPSVPERTADVPPTPSAG